MIEALKAKFLEDVQRNLDEGTTPLQLQHSLKAIALDALLLEQRINYETLTPENSSHNE